ncbi:MAG: hypothetical protein ACMVO5_13285 [Polymorphobacter sp.]|uniref:hypothetical protein n=1 Tax=Polymorphobacter sp. TaxID=1909290 RepID=UPI003A86F88B
MADVMDDPGAASRAARSGQTLSEHQLDDVANALLLLSRELWVVKDRQRVLEHLLAEAGVMVPNAVSDHQPTGALAEDLARERERYATALTTALAPDIAS